MTTRAAPARWLWTIVGLLTAATVGALAGNAITLRHPGGLHDAAPFMTDNGAAMRRMMSGMSIASSGDADRDFVAIMVPHHQGAIDMARAELRYGRNELLRRIAQEIIVGQSQEIEVMRAALGQRGVAQ